MPAPRFLDKFDTVGVVYDCMDELANFRFAPADIAERERLVISKADVVFTGGYQLFLSKSRHHDNVHFHGCGVDEAHYAKARLPETPLPPEVAGLPRPVCGYFGVIDERIDYELLEKLASRMPDASIVMVGPFAKVDRKTLPGAPNIHWLGQRTYDQLPALVKSFDVCLMPFAMNESTRYINPTKTLEYMAAAKPIVSTAVPDVVRNFTPVVQIARSHQEFVAAVKRVAKNPDAGLIAQGVALARNAGWVAIVEAMRGEMLRAVHGTEKATSTAAGTPVSA
jgi:glycosyltransferase involved in cell wall biosynthesis